MRNKKTGCAFLGLFAVFASANAADYYMKAGASDWSAVASYTTDAEGEHAAATVPSSGDTIFLPPDGIYEIDAASASFGVFANCHMIRPRSGSVVRVTVTGEATMNSAFYSADWHGELVKLGNGTLTLASTDKAGEATFMRDYQSGITVSSGTLVMPQAVEKNYVSLGKVTVAEGATLFTSCAAPGFSGAWTRMMSLHGAGLVTNAPPPDCSRTSHYIALWGTGDESSRFDGKIMSPIAFYNDAGGSVTLTNPESNFGTMYISGGTGTYPASDKGTISVPSLAYPGPLGGWGVQFRDNGGTIHYYGTGEETRRCYDFYQPATAGKPSYFDAGANGNISFLAGWRLRVDNTVRPVVLMGSNTTAACVFNNAFEEPDTSAFYFVKRGSGTWRFSDTNVAWRNLKGGMAIEDGVVEFESIAERGAICSLGLATKLTACDSMAIRNGAYVPYAYTFGGEAGGCGFLSYVGSTNAVCTTRPAVVAGAGGFRNDTDTVFCFAGITARDSDRECTFVIDGSGAAENRIADITNGMGTVSVVKNGTGTWKLTGEQSFSGDLKVNAGTLLVEGKNEKYTWFRWTVKELRSTGNTIRMRQFALLDANGYQQNVNLSYAPLQAPAGLWKPDLVNNDFDYLALEPGQMALGRRTKAGFDEGCGPEQLFKGGVSGNAMSMSFSDPDTGEDKNISSADPASWFVLAMRLPDSANEVVAHDVMGFNYSSHLSRWPKRAMIEASTDGVKWDTVYEEQDYVLHSNATSKNNYWYNSGDWRNHPNRIGSGYAHSSGHVTRSPLENVRSVSVAANATLKSNGSLAIRSLTVDAEGGMGTIDGFSFAETGCLTVENADAGKPIAFHGTFKSVTGLSNLAGWSVNVKVNGRSRRCYSVAVDEETGRVTLNPCGLMIRIY